MSVPAVLSLDSPEVFIHFDKPPEIMPLEIMELKTFQTIESHNFVPLSNIKALPPRANHEFTIFLNLERTLVASTRTHVVMRPFARMLLAVLTSLQDVEIILHSEEDAAFVSRCVQWLNRAPVIVHHAICGDNGASLRQRCCKRLNSSLFDSRRGRRLLVDSSPFAVVHNGSETLITEGFDGTNQHDCVLYYVAQVILRAITCMRLSLLSSPHPNLCHHGVSLDLRMPGYEIAMDDMDRGDTLEQGIAVLSSVHQLAGYNPRWLPHQLSDFVIDSPFVRIHPLPLERFPIICPCLMVPQSE